MQLSANFVILATIVAYGSSVFAVPTVSTEFDLEARDVADLEEVDARDFVVPDTELETREVFDDALEVDAREFDEPELEAREIEEPDFVFERALSDEYPVRHRHHLSSDREDRLRESSLKPLSSERAALKKDSLLRHSSGLDSLRESSKLRHTGERERLTESPLDRKVAIAKHKAKVAQRKALADPTHPGHKLALAKEKKRIEKKKAKVVALKKAKVDAKLKAKADAKQKAKDAAKKKAQDKKAQDAAKKKAKADAAKKAKADAQKKKDDAKKAKEAAKKAAAAKKTTDKKTAVKPTTDAKETDEKETLLHRHHRHHLSERLTKARLDADPEDRRLTRLAAARLDRKAALRRHRHADDDLRPSHRLSRFD